MEYTKENYDILIGLRRIVSPNGEQMNQIYNLYKLYINPNARPYTTGCSCDNDIASYYYGLMGWFAENETNFK